MAGALMIGRRFRIYPQIRTVRFHDMNAAASQDRVVGFLVGEQGPAGRVFTESLAEHDCP